MFRLIVMISSIFTLACASSQKLELPARRVDAISGSEFFKKCVASSREEREEVAVKEILNGNIPSFQKHLHKIRTFIIDSNGRKVTGEYYVIPDYLSIGNDVDWVRLPLTPMAAQKIADSLRCFLPTRKMVNDIYQQAVVKLEPVPLYAFRDSAISFWHHHLIIEGQRKKKPGLIAGIKKDLVISGQITRDAKPNRVAIYGWHKPDGKPIQPLYTGHVNWYVDYSHGIRLVYQRIKVNGRWMHYTDVLKDPILKNLICDEEYCDFYRYDN